jgi:hypothetical protein
MFTLRRTFIDALDAPIVGLQVLITEHMSNNPIRYSLGNTDNLLTSKSLLVTDDDGVISCVVHDDDGCRISVVQDGVVLFQEDYVASALIESANVRILEALPGTEIPAVTLTAVRLLPSTINATEGIPYDASIIAVYSDGTYTVNPVGATVAETGDAVQDGSNLNWTSATVGAGTATLRATFNSMLSNIVTVNVAAAA